MQTHNSRRGGRPLHPLHHVETAHLASLDAAEALRVIACERTAAQDAQRRETVALRQLAAAVYEADQATLRALGALGVGGEAAA